MSGLSRREQNSKIKGQANLNDFQIIQNIDLEEDPTGEMALKKINFHNSGLCCPRKEFATPREAIKALQQSKTKVTEMMH